MKKLFLLLIICVNFLGSSAAEKPAIADTKAFVADTTVQLEKVAMADALRQDGKIYVVVAVITAIFLGLLLYLFFLDRKIGKMEKEIKNSYAAKP